EWPGKIAAPSSPADRAMRTDRPGRRCNDAATRAMVRGSRGMERGDRALDEVHPTRAAQLLQLSPAVGVSGEIQFGAKKRALAETLRHADEPSGKAGGRPRNDRDGRAAIRSKRSRGGGVRMEKDEARRPGNNRGLR